MPVPRCRGPRWRSAFCSSCCRKAQRAGPWGSVGVAAYGGCLLGPCLTAGCRLSLTCMHPLSVLCSSEDGITQES